MAKKGLAAKGQTSETKPGGIVRANVQSVHRLPVKSQNFASLYANDVQVQTTPWDIRLILGEITDVSPPTKDGDLPTMTITQVGDLRMSVQLAKKLTMILLSQLQGYEQNIGPIPLLEE